MWGDNVELVREHVKAFLAKDTERANAFLDPHVVWDGSRTGGVETGNVTYGIQQLDDFVRSFRGAFDRFDWDVHGFVELGPGVVLGLVTETGSGRQSGVPVNRSYALVYVVIDRKIARITLFPSEDEARAALGHQVAEQVVLALNRRDPGPLLAVIDSDFEGASALVEAEGGRAFRGAEGAQAWFENLVEVYESIHASIEQTIAVGEQALHLVRLEFVGKGSGVPLETRVAWVIETRGGRIAFMHSHLDLAEAFDEMGRRLARTSSAA